jgi:predicted nucleic acid-binding protein
MPLDVPAGQTVFIDSTILHYAFVNFPASTPDCIELLNRVGRRDLAACVTVPVLNDAVHKVMCSEAKEHFNQPRAGLVTWLKSHPDHVRQLTAADDLLQLVTTQLPIRLLPLDADTLVAAQSIVRAHGLLASDALIVATMQQHGITHLVTNDNDFDRVPNLAVWKPR